MAMILCSRMGGPSSATQKLHRNAGSGEQALAYSEGILRLDCANLPPSVAIHSSTRTRLNTDRVRIVEFHVFSFRVHDFADDQPFARPPY
jgi:hypothetical protein